MVITMNLIKSISEPTQEISTQGWDTQWSIDSKPVTSAITIALGGTKDKSAILIPPLVQIVVEYLRNNRIFDQKDWEGSYGKVDPAPLLSPKIEAELQAESIFFLGKKVKETCDLVFFPKKINETLLTSDSIDARVGKWEVDRGVFYTSFTEEIKKSHGAYCEEPHWALVTDLIPETMGLKTECLQKFIALPDQSWGLPPLRNVVITLAARFYKERDNSSVSNNFTLCIIGGNRRDLENIVLARLEGTLYGRIGALHVLHVNTEDQPTSGISLIKKL